MIDACQTSPPRRSMRPNERVMARRQKRAVLDLNTRQAAQLHRCRVNRSPYFSIFLGPALGTAHLRPVRSGCELIGGGCASFNNALLGITILIEGALPRPHANAVVTIDELLCGPLAALKLGRSFPLVLMPPGGNPNLLRQQSPNEGKRGCMFVTRLRIPSIEMRVVRVEGYGDLVVVGINSEPMFDVRRRWCRRLNHQIRLTRVRFLAGVRRRWDSLQGSPWLHPRRTRSP